MAMYEHLAPKVGTLAHEFKCELNIISYVVIDRVIHPQSQRGDVRLVDSTRYVRYAVDDVSDAV